MGTFADACHQPFSNGTEERAWMACWCEYCARDHAMHYVKDDRGEWVYAGDPGDGCSLLTTYLLDEWPEGWVPEPDDGEFGLPSRMVCTAFTPCTAGTGSCCHGDPAPEARAERVAAVAVYWKGRS